MSDSATQTENPNFVFSVEPVETIRKPGLWERLRGLLWVEKLNNPLGLLLYIAFSLLLGFVIYKRGYQTGAILLGGLIGGPVFLASIFNLRLGIIVIITLSYFLLGIKRALGDVPIGLAMDGMIFLMFFGLFIKQIEIKDWSFAKNPITQMVLIWIVYNLLEVANPAAESRLAWVYTVRSIAGFMVMYFIILYSLKDRDLLDLLLKLWITLSVLGAAYGFYQEYVGFQQFEMNWIMADKRRYGLLWIMGRFRKFSFFSDPMVFGFVMAYSAILCFVLMGGPYKKFKKVALGIGGAAMVLAMVYSGTRAAYVLLPVAMVFYVVITFKKQVIAIALVFLAIGLVVVNMPTSNPNLVRFQTAFRPNEDESYKVRKKNQAFIQPYIQTHPLGGGLGSVGVWGEKFSPHSPLSKFPPDSGYVRIAVEMGWIGLAIYLYLLYTVMKVGVNNHFRLRDPKIKNYSLALLTVMYTLIVANFPQEAIGQIPTSLIFFLIIALVNKLKDYDDEIHREQIQTSGMA